MSKKQSQDEVQTVADVTLRLIDARQKLQDGWCRQEFKHVWKNGDVSYCMMGALGYRNRTVVTTADPVAADFIRLVLPKLMPITEWNDKPGRTQDEVLSLMDKAIARSMSRG